ncbi:MAG: glycosyltransferase family 4 protein [Prevotella sp.]|nr:glycosyltransferase family 4 protein [Prevotella sp.]
MRILIVNTSEQTGGAAVAANRLLAALNNNGAKAKMLVRDKQTENVSVVSLPQGWRHQWNFLWERWCIFWRLRCSRKHLFDIDTAQNGWDITTTPEFREADIIHLHWVNQGMLSLKGIRKILESGKPVVWTMHDIWPATAICHLTLDCDHYRSHCSNCRYLPGGGGRNDLSARVWRRKQAVLSAHKITFVACSKWLAGEAEQSALLAGQQVVSIPNPIDLRVFRRSDKAEARKRVGLPAERQLILFVSQRVTNRYKGMTYLVGAVKKLAVEHPEMKEDTAMVVLGGHAEDVAGLFPLPVYPLGYVNDVRRIVDIYNAVDLFVLPSLSENLPNTIMEAMACGVPCVGFRIGGIPEEIDHRVNGYVAAYKDVNDLARGIHWVLRESDPDKLAERTVSKVASHYSQQRVALQYIDLYRSLLSNQQER